MRNIIFIGGIHGSGKGVICENIVENSNLIHLTASEVLKWHELSSQANKVVQNIKETQNRLTSNLKAIIQPNHRYLLDGHYSLLNSQGIPEKVPISTFKEISPSKLILIIADPEIIIERLKNRDFNNYSKKQISEFQQLEIEYAKELECQLKIPLLIIDSISVDFNGLKKYIR